MVKPSIKYEASGLFVHFRYWVAQLLYHAFSALLVRDGSWQQDVFKALAPKAGDRILDFGPGSSATAISLALRYPEAAFVAADSNLRAVENARHSVARKNLGNISIVDITFEGRLPFEAGSFDKAVCMLGLHDCPPEEKLRIVKEAVRVVRHGAHCTWPISTSQKILARAACSNLPDAFPGQPRWRPIWMEAGRNVSRKAG